MFYELLMVKNKQMFEINFALTRDMPFDVQENNFSKKHVLDDVHIRPKHFVVR